MRRAAEHTFSFFSVCGTVATLCMMGWLVQSAGLSLLFPFGVALVVGVPLYFLASGRRRKIVPAVALQIGLAGSGLLAAGILLNDFGIEAPFPVSEQHLSGLIIENGIFAMLAFVVFLWPHLLPITLLAVYNGFSLPLFIVCLNEDLPGVLRAGCYCQIAVRALVILIMYEAYLSQLPRRRRPDAPKPGDYPPGAFVGADWARRVWDDSLARAQYAEPEEPARQRVGCGLVVSALLAGLAVAGGALVANYLARAGKVREAIVGIPADYKANPDAPKGADKPAPGRKRL